MESEERKVREIVTGKILAMEYSAEKRREKKRKEKK
jgi:hypothetical protein